MFSGAKSSPIWVCTSAISVFFGTAHEPTGLPATILVEATITGGTANADGSATVSGTATVTMASQTLTGVPVTALMTTSGITLTVGTTTLSPQTVTDGAIHIGPQ